MLPASWRPSGSGDLIRVGSEHDGGYPVSRSAVMASRFLLGMGLNTDWNFEAGFRRLNPVPVRVFDHTLGRRFWLRHFLGNAVELKLAEALRYVAYRRFFSQADVVHDVRMIGYDREGGASLRTVLSEVASDAIFLKVDIEGWEYRILDDIVSHADRFTGIAMEIHDLDLNRDRVTRFIEAMSGFTVVAMHANNTAGTDDRGDPLVAEFTMTRNDLLVPGDAGAGLVTANDAAQADIVMEYAQA